MAYNIDFLAKISKLPIEQIVKNFLVAETNDKELNFALNYIVEKGYRFSADELSHLNGIRPYSLAYTLLEMGYEFTTSDVIILGNPPKENYDWTLAHEMARRKQIFSIEDLMKLGNPATNRGWTVAHEMAEQGYIFSLSDLLSLGNPSVIYSDGQTNAGWTVAHVIASKGYNFNTSDLIALGNPADLYGFTVAHQMVENGYQFSASDLIVLGNPAVRNGWTLAHEITSKGHFFRTSEILKLGNPQTRDGRTIAHVMAKNGRSFSESELARLGNLTGIEAGEYVPEFRIYVDASEEIGEMILAAAEKFMSSPYYNYKEDGSLDLSGGYGWDVKPPLVIFPINEDVKIIGHQIRDAIKLPRLRSYSSKYKQELEEKYKLLTNKMDERRRKFSSDKFYDRDNRLQFLASNAPNPEFYVRRYAHLIIEDDENDQYRIFERISSAHLPEIRIPLDCTDEELGWAVLEMTNRSSHE